MHANTFKELEGPDKKVDALTEKMANFKMTGTDADMDYYEMRYQQRVRKISQILMIEGRQIKLK